MRILHLSTSDGEGGAARAAFRLHQGLRQLGVESQMLVQVKTTDDPATIAPQGFWGKSLGKVRPLIDNLPLKQHPQVNPFLFSLQYLPTWRRSQIQAFNPDLVHLQWICDGFLSVEAIARLGKPLVWTLRDMWAFTGGCHYTEGCDRYTQVCGTCPQLHSQRQADLSHWVWQRKARSWQQLNLTVVTLSHWLADCARASSLFCDRRIEVIPNGIDLDRFQRIDQTIARQLLRLPQDRQLILAGITQAADDHRKGVHLLIPALQELSRAGWADSVDVVVFGSAAEPPELGLRCHRLGRLKDDIALNLAYAAADVFVLPALQDNLPNTVLESLASGTPAVGFKIGGLPDLIEHQVNGYLAQPFEIEDLVRGLIWVLSDRDRRQKLSDRARQKVTQDFALERQAQRYRSLYTEIFDNLSSM